MNAASELARVHAVLHAASRDLADMRDERSLQRCAWLLDVALQLIDDLSIVLEQREAATQPTQGAA